MEVFDATKPQQRPIRNRTRKTFTVEHANRTLPLVKRIVADMVRQYKKVCALEERCHIRRPTVTNEEQAALRRSYEIELDKLRDLADELRAIGCELKDWRRGLVDFPSTHEGREIELCWRLGEERVEHWHDVGAGFASRQLLETKLAADPVA